MVLTAASFAPAAWRVEQGAGRGGQLYTHVCTQPRAWRDWDCRWEWDSLAPIDRTCPRARRPHTPRTRPLSAARRPYNRLRACADHRPLREHPTQMHNWCNSLQFFRYKKITARLIRILGHFCYMSLRNYRRHRWKCTEVPVTEDDPKRSSGIFAYSFIICWTIAK